MNDKNPRNYNCKDEELPMIAALAYGNLMRDVADFKAYSPKFDDAFTGLLKTQIELVEELVSPKAETAQMKLITQRIYSTMAELLDRINKLEGYIEMAGQAVPISLNDFETTDLRAGLYSRDLEKAVNRLKNVLANIKRYEQPLKEQGLTDEMTAQMEQANTQLKADKAEQYQTLNNRKQVVQNNLAELNKLNELLKLVLKVGQILYKKADPLKKEGYLFTKLRKQVNSTTGPRTNDETGTEPEA
jgi:uncharacterized protein YqeY